MPLRQVWATGGVVVPLALSHPDHELEYVLSEPASEMATEHGVRDQGRNGERRTDALRPH